MTGSPEKITAASLNRTFVLSKCDYFVDVQIWPLHERLDPVRWLSNFSDPEEEHAIHLLNSFLYFCDPFVDQLLHATFQRLSTSIAANTTSLLAAQIAWSAFLDTVLVTHVTGEVPSPTDSGYRFARRARQVLGIPEERIVSPQQALARLLNSGPRPLVFVDDFVGSGNQFVSTWTRDMSLDRLITSFEKAAPLLRDCEFYYCPLICTEKGAHTIRLRCPDVTLTPAHLLSSRYSAISDDSVLWPLHLQPTAVEFIQTASFRAGIPDRDGRVNDWRGFHKLGLALAIGDSVPDATLPLFYWEQNGWKPLIRRT